MMSLAIFGQRGELLGRLGRRQECRPDAAAAVIPIDEQQGDAADESVLQGRNGGPGAASDQPAGVGDEKSGPRLADRIDVRIDRYALRRLGKLREQTTESFSVVARTSMSAGRTGSGTGWGVTILSTGLAFGGGGGSCRLRTGSGGSDGRAFPRRRMGDCSSRGSAALAVFFLGSAAGSRSAESFQLSAAPPRRYCAMSAALAVSPSFPIPRSGLPPASVRPNFP